MTAETNLNQALAFLNAFASVGVKAFDVTLTDLEGKKLAKGFYCNRSLHQLRHLIGPMLRDATAHQHNVIIRPRQPARAELVQLDDLAAPEIDRLDPVSPGRAPNLAGQLSGLGGGGGSHPRLGSSPPPRNQGGRGCVGSRPHQWEPEFQSQIRTPLSHRRNPHLPSRQGGAPR